MWGCGGKEICHLASATSAELVSGLKSRTALGAGANLCGSGLGFGFGLVGRLQRLFHSGGFSSSSGFGLGARGLFGGSGSLFLGNTSLLGLILGTGGLNCRVLFINRRVNGVYLGKLIGKTGSELGFTRGRVQCLAQFGIGGTKRFAQTRNLILRSLYLYVQLFFGHYDTCQSYMGQRHSHHRVAAIVYRAA